MTTNSNMPEFLTDINAIMQKIADGKDAYLENRAWLATVACEAFFHAAEHGDARALTAIFQLVSRNDKASFKAWAKKTASYLITVDGKPAERSWLKHTDEKGFQVLTGQEERRKGVYTPAQLTDMTPFFDVEKKTRAKLNDADKKLKAVSASRDNLKTIVGRLDEHDIRAPLEINNAIVLVQDYFKGLITELENTVVETTNALVDNAAETSDLRNDAKAA
jgi:hypothetical protein